MRGLILGHLGSIGIILIAVASILWSFVWYKYNKREKERLEKISRFAKVIQAFNLLEETYIERIKIYEPSKQGDAIKDDCRKKMKKDNQITVTLLSKEQVEHAIIK